MWIGKNVLAAEFHHCPGPHSQRLSQSDCFEDLLGVWTKKRCLETSSVKGPDCNLSNAGKEGREWFFSTLCQ